VFREIAGRVFSVQVAEELANWLRGRSRMSRQASSSIMVASELWWRPGEAATLAEHKRQLCDCARAQAASQEEGKRWRFWDPRWAQGNL
jgi:hypothetical protein